MYCKLFASLYQGTLRGASHEILVFTNLLAHAGRDGVVDKHFRAISEETGLTVNEVKQAILTLESPDPESRSPDEDGARIVRMDEHRVWGWRVVNYGKYRAIRSEEDRAEQNRISQQRWRNKNKPASATVSHDKPRSAQGEGEAEADGERRGANKSRAPSDDLEWMAGLRDDPAYKGVDVAREHAKAVRWCKENRRQLSRRFFINWLNNADRNLDVKFKPGSTTVKPVPCRPKELTDEQIEKNKAFIRKSVGKLKTQMGDSLL
jgi:hypothetical protein